MVKFWKEMQNVRPLKCLTRIKESQDCEPIFDLDKSCKARIQECKCLQDKTGCL